MPTKAKLTTRERTTSNVAADNLNKGSELTFAEADSNFFNLRDQSFAISDGATTTDIESGETITFSGASVSGNTVTITGGSADLGNLQVNDTTLSPITTNDDLSLVANGTGEVNVQDFSISSTEIKNSTSFEIKTTNDNQNILIQPGPDGSSDYQFVHLDSKTIHVGQDNTNVRINAAYGQGDFDIQNGASVNRGGGTQNLGFHNRIRLTDNQDGEIQIQYANGKWLQVGDLAALGGVIKLQDNLITTMRSNDDLELSANGTGSVVIKNNLTLPGMDIGDNTIAANRSNDDLVLSASGTGNVVISGLRFPNSDGSTNQYLKTDGSGNLSFAPVTATLGDLTATGSTISSPSNADLTLDPSGTGDVVLNSDTVKVDNFITSLATSSRLALAPNSADFTDVGTNNEPFLSMTKSTSGGNAQLTVADSKYIYLTTDGYAGGNYGIVLTNSEVKLAPKGTGRINLATATSTTIGSNGSASAPTANPVGYVKVKINGTEYQIPYYNV